MNAFVQMDTNGDCHKCFKSRLIGSRVDFGDMCGSMNPTLKSVLLDELKRLSYEWKEFCIEMNNNARKNDG